MDPAPGRLAVPAPPEQAMLGAEVTDRDEPSSQARIVRSFDPYLACAVRVLQPGERCG
jgi:hydrogenase large subunit